jgi:NADPH-dependent 2,4-dienoyl-CoA reductase/sulfur reductase-like enzyme
MDNSMSIGVIGAGTMGIGIAQVAAEAGHKVIVFDTRKEALDKAVAGLRGLMDKLVAKEKRTRADAEALLGRISTAENLEQLAPCGLVIEAIVENLGVKQDVFKKLDTLVRRRRRAGHEHIIAFGHGNRCCMLAPGTGDRPALFQSSAADALGGSGARTGHCRGIGATMHCVNARLGKNAGAL